MEYSLTLKNLVRITDIEFNQNHNILIDKINSYISDKN